MLIASQIERPDICKVYLSHRGKRRRHWVERPGRGGLSIVHEEAFKQCHHVLWVACIFISSKPLIDVPVMKPCSHVVCRTCTETLVRPETAASKSSSAPKDEGASRKEETHVCVVCDVRLKKKDIIELKREGGLCILFSSSFIIDLLQQARASQAGAWQKPVVAEFPSRVEFEQTPRRVSTIRYLYVWQHPSGSNKLTEV